MPVVQTHLTRKCPHCAILGIAVSAKIGLQRPSFLLVLQFLMVSVYEPTAAINFQEHLKQKLADSF